MTPTTAEATIRAETRAFGLALARYASAVVMAADNPYRQRALNEALTEFEGAIARVRHAQAFQAEPLSAPRLPLEELAHAG